MAKRRKTRGERYLEEQFHLKADECDRLRAQLNSAWASPSPAERAQIDYFCRSINAWELPPGVLLSAAVDKQVRNAFPVVKTAVISVDVLRQLVLIFNRASGVKP